MSPPAFSATDWERYRAFLAVLDQGSLSAASRKLALMQPTVRRRIEELERQLGAALFLRSPSGLTPTPLALELGPSARAMASAAATLVRTASGEAAAPSGVVRLTASEVMGVEVLPPMLGGLLVRHPGLVVELAVNNGIEDLLHRQADIAVRMVRPTQDALLVKSVGAIEVGLHAHRRLLEACGPPASPADLQRLPLIGYETETPAVRAFTQALGLRSQDFSYRTDSDLGQLAAIRAGIGIGACQVGIARRDPDLVRVLPSEFSYVLHTWIAMHEDQRAVRRMRLVFDLLVQRVGAYAAGGHRLPPADG